MVHVSPDIFETTIFLLVGYCDSPGHRIRSYSKELMNSAFSEPV